MTRFRVLIFLLFLSLPILSNAQQVSWLTFEELDSVLKVNPKPVFIDFYTDWCVYCKKMDKEAFKNAEVVKEINTKYYALKFDAESEQEVLFDGQTFTKQKGNRFHDLALILGLNDRTFAPPTMIFLDKSFTTIERSFNYLSTKALLKKLKRHTSSKPITGKL